MTKEEFFTQCTDNKLLRDPFGELIDSATASKEFWYRKSPDTWRLSDLGYWYLLHSKYQPALKIVPNLTTTPGLILKLSRLQCPWFIHSTGIMQNSKRTEILVEFAIFGDKEVMWLELCGRDLVKFLDTMTT